MSGIMKQQHPHEQARTVNTASMAPDIGYPRALEAKMTSPKPSGQSAWVERGGPIQVQRKAPPVEWVVVSSMGLRNMARSAGPSKCPGAPEKPVSSGMGPYRGLEGLAAEEDPTVLRGRGHWMGMSTVCQKTSNPPLLLVQ